ncbi:unnamed protein product, partial [Durusdinium trenchii]
GTGALIRALQEQLPTEKILLGREVLKIEEKDGGVEVSAAVAGEDQSTRLYAKRVLVTLPPRLAARVHYSPQLPSSVLEVMHRTPTWMGNAMKVVVGYDLPPSSVPFWRQKQLAGYAISERGPCQQIHDHCSGEGVSMRRHALFGWVDEDDPVKSLSKEERRLRVLEQLAQLFGEADDPNRPTPRRRCLFIRSRTGRRTLTRIIRLNPRSGSGTTRATATRRSRRPR